MRLWDWLKYEACIYCGLRDANNIQTENGVVACVPCAERKLRELGFLNRQARRSRKKR